MKKMAAVIAILPLLLSTRCALHGGAVKKSALPVIVSSSPDNGAVKVSVNAKISITVSASLDNATVNQGTVKLHQYKFKDLWTKISDTVLSSSVSYNETSRTITVAPSQTLEYDAEYGVTIEGVKDAAGHELALSKISFSTFRNPVRRAIHYSEGRVSGYWDVTFDGKGRPIRVIDYTGPGADGEWLTDDDRANIVEAEGFYDKEKRQHRVIRYKSGVDGKSPADDSDIKSYRDVVLDSNRNVIRFFETRSPGPDGKWFTADDGLKSSGTQAITAEYDEKGNQTRRVERRDSGADGIWFTEDDGISGYFVSAYDSNGNQIYKVEFKSPGPDGKWFTADDQLDRVTNEKLFTGDEGRIDSGNCQRDFYTISTYDAEGSLTREVDYCGAGADGKWLTGDDTVKEYTDYALNEDGRTCDLRHEAPGPDGKWFTADDQAERFCTSIKVADGVQNCSAENAPEGRGWWLLESFFCRTEDANGRPIRIIHYSGAGEDKEWQTGDDVIRDYTSYIYDEKGNRTRSVDYKSAGVDGKWFTRDDVVSSYIESTLDAYGRLARRVDFTGPGRDRKWFTRDDSVSMDESTGGYTVYKYDANGRETRSEHYKSVGPDGKWFTGDDLLRDYTASTFEANGRLDRTVHSTSAGPDGKWFTSDDISDVYVPEGYGRWSTYDANGRETRRVRSKAPGPDGKWFTDDDISDDFEETSYDPHGNRIQSISYSNAGPDGKLFTQDDVRKTCEEYATEF